MGILTKQLIYDNNYWLCKIPSVGEMMIEPQLVRYNTHIYQPDKAEKGRNYNITHIFDKNIQVNGYFDNDMKCYMENIDNFIVTTNFRKMFDIIKNHLKIEFRTTMIRKKIDTEQIIDYLRMIEQNNPELLI